MQDVRSTTSRGSADISVDFAWGTDMVSALLEAEATLSQVLPDLPPGTRCRARRMDPAVYPVVAFSLTSDRLSLLQLRDMAEYQLVPLLAQVGGVARVAVQGGERPEYRVSLDPGRLLAYGITVGDVARALSASNQPAAVGRMQDRHRLFLILSDTRLRSIDQIRHTVLRSGTDRLVELDNVATVGLSDVPEWQTVAADGTRAVLLPVYQQPGSDTVRIARSLHQVLEGYLAKAGGGVTARTWYDQGVLVSTAEASVRDAIAIGVGLAALVLFGFLRSWKITLVAILVVPAVLAVTGLLLYVQGRGSTS